VKEHTVTDTRHTRRLMPLLALALGLLVSGAVSAHVFPRTQTPAAGATVASPAQVRIIFDGPLEPAFSSLTVTDANGKQIETAKAVVDAKERNAISLALPPLQSGHYTVHWSAVADDGHRTHGDYSFDIR
jgi:copper resistance protein C